MSNGKCTLLNEEAEHKESVPQLPSSSATAIRRRSNSIALAGDLSAAEAEANSAVALANQQSSRLSLPSIHPLPYGGFIEQSIASLENDQGSNTAEPGSGTLSPQYTLVNSDRASMRVHTGSIRERYMQQQQQVPAIYEDDSEGSFHYPHTTSSSIYRHHQPNDHQFALDGMSMLSGLSEDGASTARVRISTTNAYNALRIGPQPASLFSGYSGRITSYAASSDPGGLASPISCYDMQFADYNNDTSPLSSCHSVSDSNAVSVIRSDIAVYSGASEDVKFPFLPDNMSEFSGPYIHSSAGAVDRGGFYESPSEHIPYIQLSPQQQQSKDTRRADRRGKKLKKRADTTPPDYTMPSLEPSTSAHPWNHIMSRHNSAAKYRPSAATANITRTPGAMQQQAPQSSHATSPAVNTAAIRPNAIMRFLKRIAPRN